MIDMHAEIRSELDGLETPSKTSFSHGATRIDVATNSESLISDMASLFEPFLVMAAVGNASDVTVVALLGELKGSYEGLFDCGIEIVVDASLYPTRTNARRVELNDETHAVRIDATGTVCLVSRTGGTVHLVQPDKDLLRLDTERLIKGLATTLAECRGELVLHSSGVVTPKGHAILFPGDSRNGKTTLLLHALQHFDVSMLSCDTTFLSMTEAGLRARGWPSNFSLSTGTLHDFDFLQPLMTFEQRQMTYSEAWSIYPKEVLNTHDVLRVAGADITSAAGVAEFVFLQFAPQTNAGLWAMTDLAEVQRWLEQVCLGSRDPLYPNWHGFRTVDSAAIAKNIARFAHCIASEHRVSRLDWWPGPDQLLRHVDLLDAQSKGRFRMDDLP